MFGINKSENWLVRSSMKFSRIVSKFFNFAFAKSSSSHFEVSRRELAAGSMTYGVRLMLDIDVVLRL